eukprot:11180056-Lingulodinium_polyedra.AAC.1
MRPNIEFSSPPAPPSVSCRNLIRNKRRPPMCPGFDLGGLANKPNIKDDAPELLMWGLGTAEEYKLLF